MYKVTHTPGPWKLILHGTETYPFPLSVHTEDDSRWIARDGTASSIANARLIAAAPELLDALENLLGGYLHQRGNGEGFVIANRDVAADARAALAKAQEPSNG